LILRRAYTLFANSIHHKYKLFDNCGIFFTLKDYFNLDKAEENFGDDNQKIIIYLVYLLR